MSMPTASTEVTELDCRSVHYSPRRHIRSWLNQFEKTKLECYSVIFGISGLSSTALGICVAILIFATYEYHLKNIIDCSVINVTHTNVKLCESYRCRVLNYCIPYICTIVFVHYSYNNTFYQSKLISSKNYLDSSCSYEPTSCISRERVQFEQMTFLKQFTQNNSQTSQCCLHPSTEQPMICHSSLNSTAYYLGILSIILCLLIGLILILLGLLIQLHLNNYLKSSHKHEDFLDTILNSQFSHGTIRSSIEKTTPVNYDILTQTISHQNSPPTTNTYPKDNLLLFDIEEEDRIFQKECLRSNYQEQIQNEILRQYQLDNEEIKLTLSQIETDHKQEPVRKNSIERIKHLLKTIDNLEDYFPNISKQVSIDSLSIDHQSSPISVRHGHVSFLIK